ncbi:TauD/TfdA family dioxygenase [Microbispora amethystogenes]|uniref:TauD/TfdA family dioxygenase n=1 Tax=Microbispora amethystogenes TaxID=1427754 RepID=UPI0033CB9183
MNVTVPANELECTVEQGKPAMATVPGFGTLQEACSWLAGGRERLRDLLDKHGAVYLRGLPIRDAADFAAVRDVVLARRTSYREKATPRSHLGDDVYSSTDLPPSHAIRLHNENSYTLTFPGLLIFCCLTAPRTGGATPVADCRQVLRNLPPELTERLRAVGWLLQRNYGPRISLDWRTAFAAESAEQVEEYCRENLISFSWGADDTLRTRQVRPAIIRHPRTGEEVWFNHAAFWNEYSLNPPIREVLMRELGPDGLPFNTAFGDGGVFSADEAGQLNAAYEAATLRRTWRPGDVMIVDNILAAHGRESFRGDRKIVVAMGEPVTLRECDPVPSMAVCAGEVR